MYIASYSMYVVSSTEPRIMCVCGTSGHASWDYPNYLRPNNGWGNFIIC